MSNLLKLILNEFKLVFKKKKHVPPKYFFDAVKGLHVGY